jgi:peptidoglycan/xylan/chitin deacetylase (PgdA/CDA1 family)
MKRALKDWLLRVLTAREVAHWFHPLTRGRVAILAAHRFRRRDADEDGTSVAALRADLAYLRSEGYSFPSLGEAVERLQHDPGSLRKAVVYTIDDGYLDFMNLAAPAFAEFDCPATVFLPTAFVDGGTWLWWDRIEFIILHTRRDHTVVELDGPPTTLRWSSHDERKAAIAFLVASVKRLPEVAKLEVIARLGGELDVELASTPPSRYAPLSWDQVRALEERGISFGPHSVSHPVLARASDEQVREELGQSWKRLQYETTGAVPVFAYPNGRAGDFGPREAQLLKDLGIAAAVTMEPGYAWRGHFDARAPLARYALPRFGYPPSQQTLVRIASGFERVRLLAQKVAPGAATSVASLQHGTAPA